MNQKNNQHYQKTHLQVQAALLELSKSRKNITVTDLCKRCKINRSTFYLHYEDIFALLREMQDRIYAEMRESYTHEPDSAKVPFSKESYAVFARHVRENQDFYRIFFRINTTFPIDEGFAGAWETIILPYFNQKGIYDEASILLRFICFQAGFTNTLRAWVDSSCKQSCEEIASIIYDCLCI